MPDDLSQEYQLLWNRLHKRPKAELVNVLRFVFGGYEVRNDPEFLRLCNRAADASIKEE